MVMTDKRSIAAAAVTTNILTDKISERLLENSVIRVYATASVDLVTMQLVVGDGVAVDDQEISDRNASIERDKDLMDEEVGETGDKIILRYRNGNAAAAVVRTRVEIEPLGA